MDKLIETLKTRFLSHMERHQDLKWETIEIKLKENKKLYEAVNQMEQTGGEPDVLSLAPNKLMFVDCSIESPSGRRSLCYDEIALKERKEHKPISSCEQMADDMGIHMLDEAMYLKLHSFGSFDLKTSSWIKTPLSLRALGGALNGEKRYERVFIFHNGAQSYYQSRGFRGYIEIK